WGECVAGTQPLYSSEYTSAAEDVARDHLLPRLLAAGVRRGEDVGPALAEVRGIGRSSLEVIREALAGREPAELRALEAQIPEGLFAIHRIKGLGPAK
ncbi:MAG: hypothetical protein ACLGHP_07985, partial [Vicinamibacteria bacterium]